MSTLTGFVLDTSNLTNSDSFEEKKCKLALSIFSEIDFLSKPNALGNNGVFSVGVGAAGQKKKASDTMELIRHYHRIELSPPASEETANTILKQLETYGASKIRDKNFIPVVMSNHLTEYEAKLFSEKLGSDTTFRRQAIRNIPVCYRHRNLLERLFVKSTTCSEDGDIDFVKKSMIQLTGTLLKYVNKQLINSPEAPKFTEGCSDIRELRTNKAKELFGKVGPFLHGGMPLYNALAQTSDLLCRSTDEYQNQVLFVFSMKNHMLLDIDGINKIKKKFAKTKAKVASCYISESSGGEQKKLHSIAEQHWDDEAKKLLDVSSQLPTDSVTMALLYLNGWKMDENKESTKVFLQVNYEHGFEDFRNLAKISVYTKDSLLDLILSVSLNIYINHIKEEFKPKRQESGTCYANASAAALHLSMHRIIGRTGGYPEFEELRRNIIKEYGKDGAHILSVLENVCPHYRLHFQEVDTQGALTAVAAHRPVVATFHLTKIEWKKFSSFYKANRRGILTKSDLNGNRSPSNERKSGHAVVLVGYDESSLRLMNSWGENWGNSGFFCVENAETLGLDFIDVYWTLNDLTDEEKQGYKEEKRKADEKLMSHIRKLQEARHKCPKCSKTSKVTRFLGTVSSASCPKCMNTFSVNDGGAQILALYLYLSTLC